MNVVCRFSLILLDQQVKFTTEVVLCFGKTLSSVPALGKCILETKPTQEHMPWSSITTAGFKFQKGQLSTEKNPLGHTCFAGAPMWLYPAFVVLQPGILTVIFAESHVTFKVLVEGKDVWWWMWSLWRFTATNLIVFWQDVHESRQ